MTEELTLKVCLLEYEKLKDEQIQRIGFRDNLLYVTLGLFGVILPFSLAKPANYVGLLVIPFVCIVLGWTYLINDEKISSISRYIHLEFAEELNRCCSKPVLRWEIAHRSDKRRLRRKIEQLIVDQMTFVLSGILAVVAFLHLVPTPSLPLFFVIICEVLLLCVLGAEVCLYADLTKVEAS